jgi:uncharacterized membrane protein (UPF0127 family)
VAVADTADLRSRGLMNVESLGRLRGMLFVFDAETTSRFTMQDTLIPLDIAFFDADGALVDVLQMEPCKQEPCVLYAASAPFRFALEAPAGALAGLPASVTLRYPAG